MSLIALAALGRLPLVIWMIHDLKNEMQYGAGLTGIESRRQEAGYHPMNVLLAKKGSTCPRISSPLRSNLSMCATSNAATPRLTTLQGAYWHPGLDISWCACRCATCGQRILLQPPSPHAACLYIGAGHQENDACTICMLSSRAPRRTQDHGSTHVLS